MTELLFNPFRRFGGMQSVLIGLAVMAFGVLLAVAGDVHFDGVIDVHAGSKMDVTFRIAVLEWLIAWLLPVLLFYLAGRLLSSSSIRFVDVLGTQGMARFPFLFVGLVTLLPLREKMRESGERIMRGEDPGGVFTASEIVQLVVSALVGIACLVWAISLMYKAYVTSCNLKGARAVISFIAALLIAEILSKVILINTIS